MRGNGTGEGNGEARGNSVRGGGRPREATAGSQPATHPNIHDGQVAGPEHPDLENRGHRVLGLQGID